MVRSTSTFSRTSASGGGSRRDLPDIEHRIAHAGLQFGDLRLAFALHGESGLDQRSDIGIGLDVSAAGHAAISLQRVGWRRA